MSNGKPSLDIVHISDRAGLFYNAMKHDNLI